MEGAIGWIVGLLGLALAVYSIVLTVLYGERSETLLQAIRKQINIIRDSCK